MQEDAFKEAVLPMLEQAYRQGYADGQQDAQSGIVAGQHMIDSLRREAEE